MWEIYAYQNSDSLFGIFNAAAAIHASGDYRAALSAVAFCGFVAALIAYAFAPHKLQGWRWLGSVVLVFSVLVVPKATVGIVDKTGGGPVAVVDNVPFGMALLGSLSSSIGNTLTGLFETAFQTLPGRGSLPSELTYQKTGLMFGNRLIQEAGGSTFLDPLFRTDLLNFINNCTRFDLLDGTVTTTTLATADNVWSLMAHPNPARFSTITDSSGQVSVATCDGVYASLNARLGPEITQLQNRLAARMNPTLSATAAAAVISTQVQQAYIKNSVADASSTAADLIRQNAMLNALDDAGRLANQISNDPSATLLGLARAQTVAQQNAAWINYGIVAEQALPVVRNVIEAISYAVFPLVVLMLLLTSGQDTLLVFKGYAVLLVWIQLWPPLYAVLNYMAAIYASYDLAAAADIGGGAHALALRTAGPVFSRALSGQAVVGYMVISIPMIAWALVKRLESVGTVLAGGLAGLQSTLSSNSGSAALGNTSLGNVAMDQVRLAPNRTSAFMSSLQSDATGDTHTTHASTGLGAVSLLSNQGFASRVVSMRISEREVAQASRQADAARSEAVATSTERAAALTDAFSRGVSTLRGTHSSRGRNSSSYEQFGETLQQLDQITKNVADSTGLSQSQVAKIVFGAAGHLGVEAGVAGIQARASGEKGYMSGLSAEQRKVLGSLNSEQIAAFKQFGDRVSRDSSFAQLISNDTREGKELAARLSTSTTRAERAESAYAERLSFAEQLAEARERGDTISVDIARDPHNLDMFLRYAQQYGGTSAAAMAMFDAELARQGLRPTRTTSTGSALPGSFDEVRARHDEDDAPEAWRGENPERTHDAHAAAVRRFGRSAPAHEATQPESPPLREELRRRGQALREEVKATQRDFDKDAQVTTTPDGTLRSNRSMATQSAKQVKEDASASTQALGDAVSDLLSRRKKNE